VLLKDAEMIQSTGKTAKKISNSAMINRMMILERFWNLCEERRSW
jgi:hypothetical protein